MYNGTENEDDISIAALDDLPTVKQIGFEDVDTLSLCTNSSILAINCGNYQECRYNKLIHTNDAICCGGFAGCRWSSATIT